MCMMGKGSEKGQSETVQPMFANAVGTPVGEEGLENRR